MSAPPCAKSGRKRASPLGRFANASAEKKDPCAPRWAARILRERVGEILAANELDCENARAKHLTAALIDRLTLNPSRIEAMACGVEEVAALPDPVGRVLATYTCPNGLLIERVSTPLGVVGVIDESRPNVTADAGALCLKSGNAVGAPRRLRLPPLVSRDPRLPRRGLEGSGSAGGLAITRAPFAAREAVGEMLEGLGGTVDAIVPRGRQEPCRARSARGAGAGVRPSRGRRACVRRSVGGFRQGAQHSIVNAKMRAIRSLRRGRNTAGAPRGRPVPAGQADRRADEGGLRGARRCGRARGRCGWVTPASEEDWRTEYLDAIISVRVVDSLDAAIDHIEIYGSHHTDCIVTEDTVAAERFLKEIDSAIVLDNASTQFADGGEFGFGAEIGIATGRMHARGPVGVEQLCTFKYRVRGDGENAARSGSPGRIGRKCGRSQRVCGRGAAAIPRFRTGFLPRRG